MFMRHMALNIEKDRAVHLDSCNAESYIMSLPTSMMTRITTVADKLLISQTLPN